MGKAVSLHPLVRRDVGKIFNHIAVDDTNAADRVARAIYRQFPKFGDHPELGPPYPTRIPKLAGIRMLPVPKYRNYLIFYLPKADEVRVLYVFHGARNIAKRMAEDIRE